MRPFLCLRALPIALLALGCGICLGRLSPGESKSVETNETAVAVLAVSQDEAAYLWGDGTLPPPLPTPAPTPENLFSLAVVTEESAPATEHASAEGVKPPETAGGSSAPLAATPAPTAAFTLQVVSRRENASTRRRVLIYHTHTYEAYEKEATAEYQETQRWRTAEEDYNVVRVGETLAGLLRGLGLEVEHDRTAFEPPDLSTAYARSLAMLEKRKADGERYDLYIDLHRDAYPASGGTVPNTVNAGGTELARLMLLVGKGEGQTGQGFAERPDWEKNLEIAQAITDGLNAQAEGLGKEVMLRSGRYNQHVAVGCVLIEAGNNMNTLPQVLAAMPYLADAIEGAVKGGGAEAE